MVSDSALDQSDERMGIPWEGSYGAQARRLRAGKFSQDLERESILR